MLPEVNTKPEKLEKYKDIIKKDLYEEIENLSKDLKGLDLVMVNSTPRGGGVAEVLKSLIPLLKGCGIRARWCTIPARNNFFEITKEIHNSLQGKKGVFTEVDQKKYLKHIEKIAEEVKDMKADTWVIHDPQPAGIIKYVDIKPGILHIHLDSSSPDKKTWDFFQDFVDDYDRFIFSVKDFMLPGLNEDKVRIFPPAINPFSLKNDPLKEERAKDILSNFGVDAERPVIAQVSRFDPWKDPIGVIKAYKIAKKEIPGLQLLLVGLFLAHDDPEAMRVFKEVEKEAGDDKDIFLFSDPDRLGSLSVDSFVNACQVGSDIILQKSLKEGFGLTVTEAMWKSKTVIAGDVGGIKIQIKNGENGFLVSSYEKAAEKIVDLFETPELKNTIGKRAKETVREKFLMPRLLRDYLKLFKEIK